MSKSKINHKFSYITEEITRKMSNTFSQTPPLNGINRVEKGELQTGLKKLAI